MQRCKRVTVALVAIVLGFASVAANGARASLPSRFTPCAIGKAKLAAHCGTVDVYEDRTARSGRTIPIHVIEIDAVHRSGKAIFWNPGGPGGADSDYAGAIAGGGLAKEMMALRGSYDLVFVDNRGTGRSHPLQCDLYPPAHPEYYFAQLFPEAPLRACRSARAKDAALERFTTHASVDDLDDVRAALRYQKIVLDGDSYGTMFFLDYARRHPTHVESMVLSGIAPPGILMVPLEDAGGAQTAMTDLIADCAKDASCSAHFPRFAEHFAALVRRFDAGPVRLTLQNPVSKRLQTVALSKEVFADRLRQTLYDEDGAAFVPLVVEDAYRRNYGPLATLVQETTEGFGRGLAMGLNLSVTCAEDIPFESEARIAATSAGSFEGAARVRAQQRACRIWNVPAVSDFSTPVRTNAAVLMISGAEDPATPPEYATEELRYLPNGRQVIVPHASHESESPCVDALIERFVRSQGHAKLDGAKCRGAAERPPFATSLKGF